MADLRSLPVLAEQIVANCKYYTIIHQSHCNYGNNDNSDNDDDNDDTTPELCIRLDKVSRSQLGQTSNLTSANNE